MKALLSKVVGGPDSLVLEEVPDLVAKPGQAIVAVKACGVNFPDVLIIEDKYQFKPPRPFSPGGEMAGIVKSVGEGVTSVKVGDRVMGNGGNGGMAEELAIDNQSPGELTAQNMISRFTRTCCTACGIISPRSNRFF